MSANSTAVATDTDTPVQSNFEYVQLRADPNLAQFGYDVQYYVTDPAFEPMSSVRGRDGKTHRGVKE